MEETMARARYVRRTAPGRRYKRTATEGGRLPGIIARQFLIALALLIVVGIVKSINSPATNFISDKVRFALQQNIDLKSAYDYVDKAVVSLKNSIVPSKGTGEQNGAGQDKGAGPVQGAGQDKDAGETNAAGQANDAIQPEGPAQIKSGNPGTDTAGTAPTVGLTPESSVLSATYVAGAEAAPDMQIPVNGVLSSRFGERTDPLTGETKFHEGIDIEAGQGAGIKAALGGTVEEAGSSPSYGNYVRLKHQGGLETVYAHCSSLEVKKGSAVKQGEVIARVGDSGASVGVHLHFEVLKDGKPVDPLGYLNFDGL